MQVDGFFLRRCKQGTLQFVLMKPIMAALTLILYAAGDYRDGDMSPTDGWVPAAEASSPVSSSTSPIRRGCIHHPGEHFWYFVH
jgi:hypothetical protein